MPSTVNPNRDYYQNIADKAGVAYTPTTINSTSLAPSSNIQLPTVPVDTTNHAAVVGGAQTTINQNAATLNPPIDPNTQQPQGDDLFKLMQDSIKNANTDLQSQTDLSAHNAIELQGGIQAKTDASNAAVQGLTTEQGKLAALQAQLNGKNYEFNTVIPEQAQQNAQGKGMTAGGLAPITAAAQRQKLLEIAPLQLQVLSQQAAVATAQGNTSLAQGILQSAQAHVDKLFQIQSQDAQAQYDYKTKQIEAVYNHANEQQKALLATKQKAADQAFQTQKDNMNYAQVLASDAIKNGQPDIAAKLLALDPKSSTYQQGISALAGKIIDPNAKLDTQLKQAQLSKINSEIAAANAADATVNPNTLQGMLNVYKSTGVLPAFGMSGKSPLRAQFYAALGADGNIVTDANTNKAIRTGLNTAYKTQQNQLSANQTAVSTLEQQLTLAQKYSDQVNRTGSPLLNKYILATKSGVFGDPETAALHNIVTTASYELAKVLSGSAASISGATVSSQADAENLLNSAMSKGQFNEVLGLMRKEAAFRLQSQKDTLNSLQNDLNNVGSLSTNLKNAAPPSTGGTQVTAPDGTKIIITD